MVEMETMRMLFNCKNAMANDSILQLKAFDLELNAFDLELSVFDVELKAFDLNIINIYVGKMSLLAIAWHI